MLSNQIHSEFKRFIYNYVNKLVVYKDQVEVIFKCTLSDRHLKKVYPVGCCYWQIQIQYFWQLIIQFFVLAGSQAKDPLHVV